MELGKLKVIKSEDYSTAKLLKFLREVEGFRPVLNSKALGGQQYTLFTIYFYPLSSILFILFFIPPSLFFSSSSQTISSSFYILIHRSICTSRSSPLSPSTAALCGRRRKGKGSISQKERKRYSKKKKKKKDKRHGKCSERGPA